MLFTTARRDWTIRICITVVVCALSASAQQPRRSEAKKEQEPAGKSIIRGRAVYADNGRPLRRAEVLLIEQDSNEWRMGSVTDRSGEFVFSNVSAGKYFVTVTALDIVSPALQMGRNDSLKIKIAMGQIEDGFSEVTVDGRSSVKTEIRASRGGVITGRVLTDEDEPIPKAQISIFRIEKGGRTSSLTDHFSSSDKLRLETDSRGVYRLPGLASGDYIVRASESNEGRDSAEVTEGSYSDGSMMFAFYPKALRVQDATTVKVQQGSETTDVDIRLPDRNAFRVSGTVVVQGKAARSVTIRLNRDDAGSEIYRYHPNEITTDSNGNWEVRGVPDGSYTITASGMGGFTRVGENDGYVSVVRLRRKIVVAGGDVPNVRLELTEAGAVAGVISIESGTQRLERLRAEILSADQNAEKTNNLVETGLVRETGSFVVSGLPSGSFHLRLSGLDTGVYVKSITLDGKDALRNPIKAVEGNIVNGVRVVLSSDVVTSEGRAVDKNDRSKPLTNATVLLIAAEVERRRVTEDPIVVRTDKEGRFVVKGAPGEYFVFVFDRGPKDDPLGIPPEADLIKDASTLQKISLRRGEEKIVEVVGP